MEVYVPCSERLCTPLDTNGPGWNLHPATQGCSACSTRWLGPRTGPGHRETIMAETQVREEAVEVTVDYLPATHPFHQVFAEDTRLEVVRTDAMGFFGVLDRQERDT